MIISILLLSLWCFFAGEVVDIDVQDEDGISIISREQHSIEIDGDGIGMDDKEDEEGCCNCYYYK